MKHFLHAPWFAAALLTSFFTRFCAQAQNVGIGTTSPNAKAALEINASDKGLLIPRLDSAQRVALGTPPDGLMVFQKNGRVGLWYAFGGQWFYIPDKVKASDNLGNHTATQNLNLGNFGLRGTGSSITGPGIGVRADGGLNIGQNTAGNNVSLGFQGGSALTSGGRNLIIGYQSGLALTTGSDNLLAGYQSGVSNTSGTSNTLLGMQSGAFNRTGSENTFVGMLSGANNTTGSQIVAIGYNAGPPSSLPNLTNAIAIGSNARVTQSNSMVLGGTGSGAVNVGIGTSAPAARLDVVGKTRTQTLQITGGTPATGKVLTADSVGNASWQPVIYNASNGLSIAGTAVELGGTVTKPTTLQLNNVPLTLVDPNTGVQTVGPAAVDNSQPNAFIKLAAAPLGSTPQTQTFTATQNATLQGIKIWLLAEQDPASAQAGVFYGSLEVSGAGGYTNGLVSQQTLGSWQQVTVYFWQPIALMAGSTYTISFSTNTNFGAFGYWGLLPSLNPYPGGVSSYSNLYDYNFSTLINGPNGVTFYQGKMGLGTLAPGASLDINGTLRLQQNAATGRVLTSDNVGFATWQALPDDSGTNEAQTLTKTGATVTLSSVGGSGGGSFTDADNQTLSLSGNTLSISNGGAITLPDDSGTNEAQTLTKTGATVTLSSVAGTGGGSFTDADNQTLSISGNTLSLSNGGSVALPGDGWGNQAVVTSSVFSGNGTSTSPLSIATASAAQAGILTATDWALFNSKLTLPSFTSGSLVFSNGSTLAQNNANLFWDNANTRLGVGTNAPGQALDVNGRARLRGLTTAGLVTTDASGNLSSGRIENGLTLSGAGNLLLGGTLTSATTLTQAGYPITFTGGNVGVGTTSPSANFQVATVQSAAPSIDQLQALANTASTQVSVRSQTFTAAGSGLLTQVDFLFGGLTPNGPKTISISLGDANGNPVGGTLASATITSVPNSWVSAVLPSPINVTAGTVYAISMDSPYNWALNTTNPYPGGRYSENATTDAAFRTYISADVLVNTLSVKSPGVGINTDAPSAHLDVNGTARLRSLTTAGVVTTDANGNLGSATAASLDPTTATNGLTKTGSNFTLGGTLNTATTIATGGNNLAITGTGLVGIGSASPLTRLDINGETLLRSRLSLSRDDGSNPTTTTTWHFDNTGGALRIFEQPNLNTSGAVRMYVASGGNVGFGTTSPATTLDVVGAISLRDAGTPTALTADNQSVTVGNSSYLRLTSNSPTSTARTIVLTNGLQTGQLLLIENATSTATGNFEVGNGGTTNAITAGARNLGPRDTIMLVWAGDSWLEISYTNR